MTSTVYVDLIGPPVNAAWLNDVNNAVYGTGIASIGPTITSAADSTATTILTLPTVGSNFYQVLVYLPLAGDTANYSAYAVVSQDLTSTRIMSQVNGTRMVLSLVGQSIRATQTSGITQNITAIANAI